jgi:hypothetical protein
MDEEMKEIERNRSKGIDSRRPVTEAHLIQRMAGIRWRMWDCPKFGGMTTTALRSAGHIAGWGSRMEWVLRLIGTGVDGQSRSFDVIEISRPDGLGNIANLGLTLAEGKRLLAEVQRLSLPRKATIRRGYDRVAAPVAGGAM